MEIIAGLIVLAGCGYKLHTQVALGFPPFVTGAVEVIGVMSLLLEAFPTDSQFLVRFMNWKFRPGCRKGTWCVLLVHVAAMLSIFQAKHIFHQDVGPLLLMTYCLSVLVVSIPLQLVGVIITHRTRHLTFLLLVTATAFGLSYIMFTVNTFFGRLGEVEIAMVIVLALWTIVVQCLFHLVFPLSFSCGEATIVSHGVFLLFIFNHLLLYRVSRARKFTIRPYLMTAYSDVTIFLQTAGMSGLLVAFIMFINPSLRKSLSFYGVLLGVAGAISTPILMLALEKHFIVWIIQFITANTTRLYLFGYWGHCCILCGIVLHWTASSTLIHPTGSKKSTNPDVPTSGENNAESDSNDYVQKNMHHSYYTKKRNCKQTLQKDSSSKQTDSKTEQGDNGPPVGSCRKPKQMPSGTRIIIARKYFHIFAIFAFLPGLILDREMLMVAATCAIVVFIILEVMRKVQVWPLGDTLDQYYNVFVDKRDSGPVILTHLYLIIGCTAPLWLYPYPLEEGIHPALLSGLLSLGIGDTAASVFGTKFGYFRWPGTKKTIEGTMASIVFQIFALAALDYTNLLIGVEWTSALVAICLTSLLEAMTSQIDNLVLPLFMYILLVDPLRAHYR